MQSEKLKAQAYATAVQGLRKLAKPDAAAVEAYREIVGASREVASRHIVTRPELEADLSPLLQEYGVAEPWEVLTAMRKQIYESVVADPQVIRDNQWPHTVSLLRVARETYCKTGLATMSYRQEVTHVLKSLDLEKSLDVVLTREDVQRAKPDPEIYLLAATRLDVPPEECLVLEDSPNGVRAGVAAGMNVIAVATPFTMMGIHNEQVVDHAWVVHNPDRLLEVVEARIAEHNRDVH